MIFASNTIKLHVEDLGSGAPALIFLHYWGGSSRTWRHVTQALAPAIRTIAVDHRGWGQSDKPLEGYTLADLADDAQRMIEGLSLDHYILIGHSMGGKVAQLMASRHLAGLAGLVLVAPSPPSPMAVPLEVRQGMIHAYDSPESIVVTVQQVLAGNPLAPDDLEQVIDDSLKGAPAAKLAWPLGASQEDITAQAALIRVPTLVISGEEDRVDPPAVLRQELMSRIPQATLHLLPGIGHLSPLEAPGDLAALIRGFATPLIAPKIDRATIVGGDVIGPCSAVLVHADGMCVTTSDPDPAIATKVTAVIDDASPALSGPGHTIEGLLGPKEVAIPSAFERLTQKA